MVGQFVVKRLGLLFLDSRYLSTSCAVQVLLPRGTFHCLFLPARLEMSLLSGNSVNH